eukprot:3944772-Pyramimonas_sp.AAC.3
MSRLGIPPLLCFTALVYPIEFATALEGRFVILTARQEALDKREKQDKRERQTPRNHEPQQQSNEGSPTVPDSDTSSHEDGRDSRETKGESSGVAKRSAPKKPERSVSIGKQPPGMNHLVMNASGNKPGLYPARSPTQTEGVNDSEVRRPLIQRPDSPMPRQCSNTL